MKNTKFYKAAKYLVLSLMAVLMLAGLKEPADAANVKTSVKVLSIGQSCTVKNAGNVTSSKKSVATVKNQGNNKFKITTLKKGKSTINIYNGKGKLTKRVYLLSGNKKSFAYDNSTVYLNVGDVAAVNASTNMSGVTIQYSSSKPTVATVDANGKITAKKAGKAKITATFYYKGLKAKTVKKPVCVYSASYDTSALSLTAGDTKTVAASISSNCSVGYKSSDTGVATVSSAGKITAKKKGTATITATVTLSGKTVKTFTKKVTVKAANGAGNMSLSGSSASKSSTSSSSSSSSSSSTGSSSSSVSQNTGSSSASGSSSGSSSSKSGSDNSASSGGASESEGSASTDLQYGEDGYRYRYGVSNTSISGGRVGYVECYTNKDTDVFEFKFSSTYYIQNIEIEEGTCYDNYNECQCRYVGCNFIARIAGTFDLYIYRNGVLVRTITYTITSTDTDYFEYEAWRKGLEEELWTSGMTEVEKIKAVGDYVFARCPYVANESSQYCYKDGKGGNCGASSGLLVDVAHDLGLEAEIYYMNGTSAGHMVALIYINGVEYYAQNSASAVGEYGFAMVLKTGR